MRSITQSPAEPAFLISAIRHFFDAEFALSIPESLDWPRLLDLAQAHAVTPILRAALQNVQIPSSVSTALRASYEASIRLSLAHSAELLRVVELFGKARIPMVALKGPMLDQYLYGDLALRVFGDIDVLLKPDDVLRARDTLIDNGYRIASSLPWNSRSACLRLRGKEMSFDSPSGGSVDVHWRLMPPNFASVFDKMDPWQYQRVEHLAGHRVQTLSAEAQLLFLCAHGSKHMFDRLGWIADVARFLRIARDLDWKFLVNQSRDANCLMQLLLSIGLAVDLFGGAIPSELPLDNRVEALIDPVRARLLAGTTPPVPAPESARFTLELLELPRHRVRFLFGEYLTPSEAEYRALRLPLWLHFLYYAFRPIHLLWKNLIIRAIY
jgi:Uncharacterised nucleotidyltransferase